ncbi:MAG: isoleucine--tRNA ligase [Caldilineaceae bacterium]|nr:isoleucine--tRNA ligase [Caldilineaceae bacterium]MBP8106695.1 isoleucine--tRNA ligase [Caldilineaceae bacterium]MBP8122165.1 isoleucine--tRNA ligase [Caldilineaceae bacterium]MBP9071746.1 isoleucine--tRNA ligase [Caldilineaceae bacterium]
MSKQNFANVTPSVNYPEMETQILNLWKQKDVFRRSMEERKDGPRYVFFEGPPTANGRPGIHHVLARAFKDMFPRYKTMQGHYVLRKGGWDTHGLPVEIEVEKQLGLSGKQQIEEYGVEAFNKHSRKSVWTYVNDWEKMTERMGYWVDMDDPYVTFHNNYVESLWWILKQFWEKDLLFLGYKVVPYCPRCGTALSSHELSLGYKDGTIDPSVYVKFKVKDEENLYLLAWTTTPWTLPGNAALAVGKKIDYVRVRDASGAELIMAKSLVETVLAPGYEVLGEMKGADLLGMRYEPLFSYFPVEEEGWYVVAADFVSTEDGTGIVHIAPAFGADDMAVGRAHSLPVIQTITPEGTFKPEVTDWAGVFVKTADPSIEENLTARGLLYKSGTYEHTYPFCWRCDTPLLYYAKETWYIRTSQYKKELVALNQEINWVPEHIKEGRFGNWLENNVDWALGRDRYWGTPLPIWQSDAEGSTYMECVGSREELSAKVGRDLSELDLHRPYVDDITWPAPDGGTMRRVLEVADAWFDSGSMPVAQFHYPFENQELWAEQQQADFICEAIDQTRGWFYTLHAVSTLLFDRPAFKNVICLGHILAEDGSKMSKSKGNVVDPWEVFDSHGADATRWTMYTASPPGNSRRFSTNLVGETVRKFMNTLWNTYSFFVTYANLSDWEIGRLGDLGGDQANRPISQSPNLLDRWLLSELNRLVRDVTEAFETYDVIGATRPVADFVDTLSNWYVRQSRRRFWDGDAQALSTLHHVLVTVSQLLAPTVPFIAEEIYQNLAATTLPGAADSVHLSRWPQVDVNLIDEQLSADMATVQKVTSLGHAARQLASLKVRQPLAQVVVRTRKPGEKDGLLRHQDLLLAELNVKALVFADDADDLVDMQVHPLPKQLGQKFGAGFPKIRKALAALDQAELAGSFQFGETVQVEADGVVYAIEPGDVEVRSTPRSGFSVAEDGGYLVAITTEITQALADEGNARELVRRIQQLRKETGLEISDRIVIHVTTSPALHRLLNAFGSYVREETLAVDLHQLGADEQIPAHLQKDTFELDNELVTVAVVKK